MELFYHVAPENEVKQYADDMHHLESDLRILKDIRDKSQSLSKQHEVGEYSILYTVLLNRVDVPVPSSS